MQAISCLTFVGGFVDGAGYDLLYSIFTTAITGNIIAAASDVYVEAKGVLPRLLVCIFIGFGALTATIISMKLRFATTLNKWEVGMTLFAVEALAIFLAMIVGQHLDYPDIDSWQITVTAIMTAFAMGLQNGAALVMIPNCPVTTAMTGNLIRFFIYGAEAFTFTAASLGLINLYPTATGKPEGYSETMKVYAHELSLKFHLFFSALIPFIIGALTGVPAAEHLGFWCFFVPIVVVLFVVWTLYMGNREAQLFKVNQQLQEENGGVVMSSLQARSTTEQKGVDKFRDLDDTDVHGDVDAIVTAEQWRVSIQQKEAK